ncbi:MAG: hypothetical protein RLZZ529_1929 [Bacteroidota bacterium]
MRMFCCIVLLFITSFLFSQNKSKRLDFNTQYQSASDTTKSRQPKKVATLDLYRIITLDRDTTYIDTSLTIKKEYSHNYLRRDTFGLLPFANDGQTYNTLQYSLTAANPYPEFGFKAKHFNFLEANQIRYASVATPLTELYFKSTQLKGQSVDSYIAINTSPNLNFSLAYRGLRSEGKYINQLASTGNFRFTTSYSTQSKRYWFDFHFTQQDILNEENGGITTIDDFESENSDYKNRQRLEVYLTDAKSFLKGKRFFIDHGFRINSKQGINNLYLKHQFNYENKFFEYNQLTVSSNANGNIINRFGDSFRSTEINDQTRYNKMYNKVGLQYENTFLGKFQFFVDDFRSNYYYNQILIFDNRMVPNALSMTINSAGGQYEYRKGKWNGRFLYTRSITNQSLSNLDATMQFDLDEDNQFTFQYQNTNKLPNNNYNLHQSSYVAYNWSNNFNNEKINSLSANAITPWISASLQLATIQDHLYFNDISTQAEKLAQTQIVTPLQYAGTIKYLSLKMNKEFQFGKFALDNTVLFQKVDQNQSVLNVPEIVTRNSIYFTDFFFKKALYLQTGIVFNYFTNYYANDYNPVIGEFFVQRDKQIGNFPNLDFFVNAKIQRTRIFFKVEHFNSSLTGNTFYSAPNNPYRDMTIRFGLTWNFFE